MFSCFAEGVNGCFVETFRKPGYVRVFYTSCNDWDRYTFRDPESGEGGGGANTKVILIPHCSSRNSLIISVPAWHRPASNGCTF